MRIHITDADESLFGVAYFHKFAGLVFFQVALDLVAEYPEMPVLYTALLFGFKRNGFHK